MKILLISGSSEIGQAFIKKFSKNNDIFYTYNTTKLKNINANGFYLDISKKNQIDQFIKNKKIINWDLVIFLTGVLNPIGRFDELKPREWQKSIEVNFSNQMYLLQNITSLKNSKITELDFPTVVFTAGPGTNSANKYYSAYTLSKISLIKMTELLDYEIDDMKFLIIGPGMINTKIHNQTLKQPNRAREHYQNVVKRIKNKQYNSISGFILCIEYLINLPKNLIGGRNISFEFDDWKSNKFKKLLTNDTNKFKLRRK
jgi:NAD(P)-dependent dehydrogenase (short-subunit alcohol dehydrogenase family)